MPLEPITPQSNPELFYIRTVNQYQYYVQNYITWEVKRAMEKAVQEAYRAAGPEECKPDIDFDKFNAWVDTPEGEIISNCAEAQVLFIPKDGAPLVNFRTMPLTTFREAKNFFERPLPSNSFAPTDATAKTDASTPAA